MISALFPASNNYQNLSLLIEVFQNSKAKQGAQGPELWSYSLTTELIKKKKTQWKDSDRCPGSYWGCFNQR